MKTICVQCKWGETTGYRRGDGARYCGCPAAAKLVIGVNYVTGGTVYGAVGNASESRPLCRDMNPIGECPWWELPDGATLTESGTLILPSPPYRRSLLQRIFGI